MLREEKSYAKPNEVIGDGEEDKNHNRIQTDRRGCVWEWEQYIGMGWGWGGDGYEIFYRVIL